MKRLEEFVEMEFIYVLPRNVASRTSIYHHKYFHGLVAVNVWEKNLKPVLSDVEELLSERF